MTRQHIKKIEKLQTKRTKYSLQSLATVTQIRRQRNLGRKRKQLITRRKSMRMILISDINSEKWFAVAWKWYADDYHKREKTVLITLRRKNQHLKPLKDGTDNLK
jgi:hypothetical protein